MENASKALIIAASIIIAIVLISLGVMVLNMGQESMKNANMSEAEIMQFNAPFEAYKGVKTGTEVKTLFNKITAHNRTAKDDSQRLVVAAGTAPAEGVAATDHTVEAANTTVTTALGLIRAGYTYDISFGYDNNSGLITTVYYNKK